MIASGYALVARPTDRELLRRFADTGDGDAFAVLVHRHGSLVYGTCRRTLSHDHDAEDAFQRTFLVLARKAGLGGWQDCVAAWLRAVARRVAGELRRVEARRLARERLVAVPPDRAMPPPTAALARGAAARDALGRLPIAYREALRLCCLEGRSRAEAASQLGVSIGAVKGRLERGRELLRLGLLEVA